MEALGPRVLTDPLALGDLRGLAEDAAFRGRFAAIKRANKVALAAMVQSQAGVRVDPARCSTCRSSASTSTSASC